MSASKYASVRPLSPFMLGKYYRFQFTSLLSITHRMTGLVLSVGALALAAWVACIASGSSTYAGFLRLVESVPGRIILLIGSWSLFYHLCNGVRHLVWDAGYGLRLGQVYLAGWLVLVVSVGLTGLLWFVVFQT